MTPMTERDGLARLRRVILAVDLSVVFRKLMNGMNVVIPLPTRGFSFSIRALDRSVGPTTHRCKITSRASPRRQN